MLVVRWHLLHHLLGVLRCRTGGHFVDDLAGSNALEHWLRTDVRKAFVEALQGIGLGPQGHAGTVPRGIRLLLELLGEIGIGQWIKVLPLLPLLMIVVMTIALWCRWWWRLMLVVAVPIVIVATIIVVTILLATIQMTTVSLFRGLTVVSGQ